MHFFLPYFLIKNFFSCIFSRFLLYMITAYFDTFECIKIRALVMTYRDEKFRRPRSIRASEYTVRRDALHVPVQIHLNRLLQTIKTQYIIIVRLTDTVFLRTFGTDFLYTSLLTFLFWCIFYCTRDILSD